MSVNKEFADKLLKHLNELYADIIKFGQEEQRKLNINFSILGPSAPPVEPKPVATAAWAKQLFPDELLNLLEITDQGPYLKIKPTRFLGDQFNPIADVMKSVAADYVSAGKDSHWRIEKQ